MIVLQKLNKKIKGTSFSLLAFHVIVALLFVPFAQAVEIFSDNFETGDTSKWTSTVVETGNTLGVTAQSAQSGSYGLHFTTGTTNDDAMARKQIAGQTDLYMRTYMRLNQNVGPGYHKMLMTATTTPDSSPYIGTFGLRTANGYTNRAYTYSAGAWRDAGTSLQANQWYCMEMHVVVSSTNGRIQLWKDDALIQDVSGINTGTAAVTYARLGADGDKVTSDVDVDNFVVDTARVGCADITPPIRSNGAPSGTLPSGTTQATLSLNTDENAVCKYGSVPGTIYDSLPNTFSTTGGSSHSTAITGLEDGNIYNNYVRCQDAQGNSNTDDFVISFNVAMPDTTPPVASISINNGNATATSSSVLLSLSCTDISGVQDVRYSNDGVFDTESFEAYSTTKPWTLSSGDGLKTVYYQCRDNSPNANSITVSDTITLDTTAPLTSILLVEGDNTAPYEDTSDDGDTNINISGEAGMTCRFYTTDVSYNDEFGTICPVAETTASCTVTTASNGNYVRYVACKDAAGNGQTAANNLDASWSVNVPVAPPSASILINSGASSTSSASVSLTLSCNATAGIQDVRYSNDGVFDTELFEAFAGSKSWVLSSGDGTKIVYYQCRDTANNSAFASDSIVLDTTTPATAILAIEGDLTYPYEDVFGDGNTDVVIDGETGMTCRWYDSDVSYTDSSGTLCSTAFTQATCIVSPTSNGLYTKYIACKDVLGNGQTSANNLDVAWTVNIPDTTPPLRDNGQPTGSLPAGTTQATISLDTDEAATCKYSTVAGTSYDSMINTFGTMGGTSHSQLITGLDGQSTYNYYTRCQDTTGNKNPDDFTITISFSSFNSSKLKQTKVLAYKYSSGDYTWMFEEPFEEFYNFDVTFFNMTNPVQFTSQYLEQFDVILHSQLNSLSSSEETALINWANQPGHSLIGSHSSPPSSQALTNQIFGITVGSGSSLNVDKNTINESYSLGTILKYSRAGASLGSSLLLSNVNANVIARLTSGTPCVVEKNNHVYVCSGMMRESYHEKSPAQPALLSGLSNIDIVMPKLKFFVTLDDEPTGFWGHYTTGVVNKTALESAVEIINGHGAPAVQAVNSKRIDDYPSWYVGSWIEWVRSNFGRSERLSHSWDHLNFDTMTVQQQDSDFINFDLDMDNYNLTYEPLFAAPSASGNMSITPAIASNHGFKYFRTSFSRAQPYLYDFKDGTYVLMHTNFRYAATLDAALYEPLTTYHGFTGPSLYSHFNDGYDTANKLPMLNASLGIMNSIEWSELGGVKDFVNMHRLYTNRFYREGDIMYVESVGEFDAGYTELFLPQTDAKYCKLVGSDIFLLQCKGKEVYVPVPSSTSAPVYIEVHSDTAPADIARLVSYDPGVFFNKAEYQKSINKVELYAHGFGKKIVLYYPTTSFVAKDNSAAFATVQNGVLTGSTPSYNVVYDGPSKTLTFEVPTLMTEQFSRSIVVGPSS